MKPSRSLLQLILALLFALYCHAHVVYVQHTVTVTPTQEVVVTVTVKAHQTTMSTGMVSVPPILGQKRHM